MILREKFWKGVKREQKNPETTAGFAWYFAEEKPTQAVEETAGVRYVSCGHDWQLCAFRMINHPTVTSGLVMLLRAV